MKSNVVPSSTSALEAFLHSQCPGLAAVLAPCKTHLAASELSGDNGGLGNRPKIANRSSGGKVVAGSSGSTVLESSSVSKSAMLIVSSSGFSFDRMCMDPLVLRRTAVEVSAWVLVSQNVEDHLLLAACSCRTCANCCGIGMLPNTHLCIC